MNDAGFGHDVRPKRLQRGNLKKKFYLKRDNDRADGNGGYLDVIGIWHGWIRGNVEADFHHGHGGVVVRVELQRDFVLCRRAMRDVGQGYFESGDIIDVERKNVACRIVQSG